MKSIKIYIYPLIIVVCTSAGTLYASSDKNDITESPVHNFQHPPHDHHETDHIKKLDEAMRKKRQDEQ